MYLFYAFKSYMTEKYNSLNQINFEKQLIFLIKINLIKTLEHNNM